MANQVFDKMLMWSVTDDKQHCGVMIWWWDDHLIQLHYYYWW